MLRRPASPLIDQPLPLKQSPGFARALTQLDQDATIESLQGCGQVLVVSSGICALRPVVRYSGRISIAATAWPLYGLRGCI
jgi:hypothetical protein